LLQPQRGILRQKLLVNKLARTLLPAVAISAQRIEQSLGNRSFDFRCTACGICCQGRGSVYFSRPEMAQVARFLKYGRARWKALKEKLIQSEQAGLLIHSAGQSCLFLVNKKCAIYPVRPLQCKSYPFWPSNFQSKASLGELREECPGSLKGSGAFFSLQQVQQKILRTQSLFQAQQTAGGRKVSL
jgi:Fe-S-cluster containining protein